MSVKRPCIMLITDSLAFPRSEPEFIPYEDTYVALLKTAFPDYDFVHVGRGGATIVDLHKHTAYYHDTIKPELVLMHSGIVDCAPRALTIIEHQIILRLPIIGSIIGALIKRYAKRIRNWRKITYTPLPLFQEYVGHFESLYRNVHWIGILPALPAYNVKVPGIASNIEKYNRVLSGRQFISTDDFVAEDIMSDYHHLSRLGHQKLFEKLSVLVAGQLQRTAIDCQENTASSV